MDILKAVQDAVNGFCRAVYEHKTELLLGGGIASSILTVGLGIQAGHKAERAITSNDEAMEELSSKYSKLKSAKKFEKAKAFATYKFSELKYAWPYYIPPMLSASSTILCFYSAYRIEHQESLKLASACVAAETLVTKYQDQFVEPQNAQERKANARVDDQFYEEAAERYENAQGEGDVVFYDAITGMVFRSSEKEIRRAESEVLRGLNGGESVTVSDFYGYLNPSLDQGIMTEYFGWGCGTVPHMTFDAKMIDGKPVGVLHYKAYFIQDLDGIRANNDSVAII